MALAFADAGADIIVASRKIEACEEAAEQIRGKARRAYALSVHAGKWAQVERLLEDAYAAFERVDILVNKAGMGPMLPSHKVSDD